MLVSKPQEVYDRFAIEKNARLEATQVRLEIEDKQLEAEKGTRLAKQ